jgi:hypothetical protein
LFPERGDFSAEHGQMMLDNIPDTLVPDDIVAVNEDVSEIDDLTVTGKQGGDLRLDGKQPSEGFADDDELALDDRNIGSA